MFFSIRFLDVATALCPPRAQSVTGGGDRHCTITRTSVPSTWDWILQRRHGGEGYENTAWSKGTRPRLGVGSEKFSHERRVWTDIWKLRGKKAGGSQANRQDRPGHFTSLKRRWLVYLALRPRWPLDLDFSLGNLVCKYPTAYHS